MNSDPRITLGKPPEHSAPELKNIRPGKSLPSLKAAKKRDNIDLHNIKVLATEDHTTEHRVNWEAIAIKQGKPSLNREEGLDFQAVYNSLNAIADKVGVIQTKYSNF